MKDNFREISKKVVIYCLCGAILTPTLTGFVCQNPTCPDYLLEKNEHIPERRGTNLTYLGQIDRSIGTIASSATIYHGLINFVDWPSERGHNK